MSEGIIALDTNGHNKDHGDSNSDLSDDDGIEILEVIQKNVSPPKGQASKPGTGTETTKPQVQPEGMKAVKCPICLEPPDVIAVAECGHIYCKECVYTALSASRNADKRRGECGMCRKRVPYNKTIYLEVRLGPETRANPKPEAS